MLDRALMEFNTATNKLKWATDRNTAFPCVQTRNEAIAAATARVIRAAEAVADAAGVTLAVAVRAASTATAGQSSAWWAR